MPSFPTPKDTAFLTVFDKMPRRNLDGDCTAVRIKGKVRKRGCSSSSSSSMGHNYRLKRMLVVGKKGGSTTPFSLWKVMSSRSPSLENDKALKYLNGEKPKALPLSARKLAAKLWEINGMPSPRSRGDMEDQISEVAVASRLSSMENLPESEGNSRRRASDGSKRFGQSDCNLGRATSLHNCLVQVYQTKDHLPRPCQHMVGLKNCLKDVYDGLTTSRELLKLFLSRVWRPEQMNSTSLSIVSALEIEIDRTCSRVYKLVKGRETNMSETDTLLQQEEKVASRIKQDRIHNGIISSTAGEHKMEKKIRRQIEELNEKLRKELSQTKASLLKVNKELESEKQARKIAEQVCDELAQSIADSRAEMEEQKRKSHSVREEVEKEREMLHIADMMREERVQMKLLEAKCIFEDKIALVDKLTHELEVYLKSKTGEKKGDHSPRYEKIKALEKCLNGACSSSYQICGKDSEDIRAAVTKDDTDNSDCHSIELTMDELKRSLVWGDAVKNESKRTSVHRSKGRKSVSDQTPKPKFANVQEDVDILFGSIPHGAKNEIEDEMKRYKMIKDLRDHIFSGSRAAPSPDLATPSKNLSRPSVCPGGFVYNSELF